MPRAESDFIAHSKDGHGCSVVNSREFVKKDDISDYEKELLSQRIRQFGCLWRI